ncbi:methyltransferase [Ammoniphilus oxalaticus]|uniref:S-adenosyl-L-methionine-dependent methyltransferase n=1 Tax=Ammoniphilus oxalaticus TaxID=66863 RepID=A0A419SL98_9BACL|nr:class I SAM-dependent methyltransferase [Ammoniphilus oxalaticus]RKD24719.1 methyltransferase [Ammoniphilus oxalaticus]
MSDKQVAQPDHTAVRVALWRAMHLQVDSPPYVFEDNIGLELIAPKEDWRQRPDMDPVGTSGFRASIVARARFVEDIVLERLAQGITQYVILGAGLDTFAQRRPELSSKLKIFEVDAPSTQAWKKQRLMELGFGVPDSLHFAPVDFEKGASWWEQLTSVGFDTNKPAVLAATGVTQYLTHDAIVSMLRRTAQLAPGSTLAMTFLLPLEQTDSEIRSEVEEAKQGARASGTPFISFFTPSEMTALARELRFRDVCHVSAADLNERYFSDRTDNLRLPSGEEFLLAMT